LPWDHTTWKYWYRDKELSSFPADLTILNQVKVEYITLPGWNCDITNCKTFNELPKNAQIYIETIEDIIKVPIQWIGIGTSRNDMIRRY
jgi:adenylosuccinate synthase